MVISYKNCSGPSACIIRNMFYVFGSDETCSSIIRNNLLNILAKIRHLGYSSQAPSVFTLNRLWLIMHIMFFLRRETFSFQILTQMTALCLKSCHLNDKSVTNIRF